MARPARSVRNEDHCGKAGGVKAVTKAIQRHPSHATLLKCACGALWYLGVGNNDNRRRIAQAGGVEAVVKAMNDHPFNVLLLEQVCAVLHILSTHTYERIASCVRNEKH